MAGDDDLEDEFAAFEREAKEAAAKAQEEMAKGAKGPKTAERTSGQQKASRFF